MKIVFSLALAVSLFPIASQAGTYNDSGVTISHDCGKDPEVQVNASNSTLAITGTCKTVAINGSMITGSVAAATTISITGSNNTLTVDAIDKISAIGSMNKVTYKKALAAKKTKVSASGTGNKIVKAK